MNDDRRATGVALLGLCCLCASGCLLGCDEPARRERQAHELPLATSRHIDFLQPSLDCERLFFLTDIDAKKESATLDVVSADGELTPLAALVYQPALRGSTEELSPWWDERPLHPRAGGAAFQVSRDGSRALALLQRYGREARLLAVFDALTGAMTAVAAGVERQGYQLDADAGVYFAAGADTLYHVAEAGQERVEIARALSPVGMFDSPSGRLVAFSEGCSSEIPPQCRLALAHADGSPSRILSDKAGEQFRNVVFDGREERVLFPDDVRYIYGTNRVPATIVSAPVEPSVKGSAVQLALDVQVGSARFSPDGRWVTLLAHPREDWADPGPVMGSLQLVPAVGGVPQTLAPVALAESHFSPDGRRLYFLSEPQRGVATLQMVALPAGSRAAANPVPVKIASQAAGLRESPGGSKLLFLSGFRAGRGTLELLAAERQGAAAGARRHSRQLPVLARRRHRLLGDLDAGVSVGPTRSDPARRPSSRAVGRGAALRGGGSGLRPGAPRDGPVGAEVLSLARRSRGVVLPEGRAGVES